ncbi:hypothetical protein JST99_01035 [Candidatus Dependentiae bacterium]|nr:hypothetical protein [Candidatus Dependentiae bacterium]MCC7414786.1 hypothetical protein [Campylobacterota bacterium]
MNTAIKNLILTLAILLLSTNSRAIDPVTGARNRTLATALKAAEKRAERFRRNCLAFCQDAGYKPTEEEINGYISKNERKFKKAQRAKQQRLNRENRNPNTSN